MHLSEVDSSSYSPSYKTVQSNLSSSQTDPLHVSQPKNDDSGDEHSHVAEPNNAEDEFEAYLNDCGVDCSESEEEVKPKKKTLKQIKREAKLKAEGKWPPPDMLKVNNPAAAHEHRLVKGRDGATYIKDFTKAVKPPKGDHRVVIHQVVTAREVYLYTDALHEFLGRMEKLLAEKMPKAPPLFSVLSRECGVVACAFENPTDKVWYRARLSAEQPDDEEAGLRVVALDYNKSVILPADQIKALPYSDDLFTYGSQIYRCKLRYLCEPVPVQAESDLLRQLLPYGKHFVARFEREKEPWRVKLFTEQNHHSLADVFEKEVAVRRLHGVIEHQRSLKPRPVYRHEQQYQQQARLLPIQTMQPLRRPLSSILVRKPITVSFPRPPGPMLSPFAAATEQPAASYVPSPKRVTILAPPASSVLSFSQFRGPAPSPAFYQPVPSFATTRHLFLPLQQATKHAVFNQPPRVAAPAPFFAQNQKMHHRGHPFDNDIEAALHGSCEVAGYDETLDDDVEEVNSDDGNSSSSPRCHTPTQLDPDTEEKVQKWIDIHNDNEAAFLGLNVDDCFRDQQGIAGPSNQHGVYYNRPANPQQAQTSHRMR